MTKFAVGKKLAKTIYSRTSGAANYWLDRAWLATRQSQSNGQQRIARISDGGNFTSEQQYYPLNAYRKQIRNQLGIASIGLGLSHVLNSPQTALAGFDAVLLKLDFRMPQASALDITLRIRDAIGPNRKIIYFDGDDDLCILWPEVLDAVDLYVKKHVFKDRSQYKVRFVGKTNLTDYVAKRFGCSFARDSIATHTEPLSDQQIAKIVLGWNVGLDEKMLGLRAQLAGHAPQARPNDIVCRAGVPTDWMGFLRRDVTPLLKKMEKNHRVIAPTQRVSPEVYLQEMLSSKLCISPFGYGEICWRDFEAVLCGCLLIKPDMGHVETQPDIFKPFETYVPVKWDYSDLEEKCAHYLANQAERARITEAATEALTAYYSAGFVERLDTLLSPARRVEAQH